MGYLHDSHEVDEALQQDEFVLVPLVDLRLHLGVEPEVVHQFLVVDTEHRHRGVEVLLHFMQTQVDRLEVNLQVGRVLFLLGNLLLLLKPDLLL